MEKFRLKEKLPVRTLVNILCFIYKQTWIFQSLIVKLGEMSDLISTGLE